MDRLAQGFASRRRRWRSKLDHQIYGSSPMSEASPRDVEEQLGGGASHVICGPRSAAVRANPSVSASVVWSLVYGVSD